MRVGNDSGGGDGNGNGSCTINGRRMLHGSRGAPNIVSEAPFTGVGGPHIY